MEKIYKRACYANISTLTYQMLLLLKSPQKKVINLRFLLFSFWRVFFSTFIFKGNPNKNEWNFIKKQIILIFFLLLLFSAFYQKTKSVKGMKRWKKKMTIKIRQNEIERGSIRIFHIRDMMYICRKYNFILSTPISTWSLESLAKTANKLQK